MAEVVVPLTPDVPAWTDGDDGTFVTIAPGETVECGATIGATGIDPATVTRVTVRLRLTQGASEFGEGHAVYVFPEPYSYNIPRTLFNLPNVPAETLTTVELDLLTSFGADDPLTSEPAHLAEFLAANSYTMAFVQSDSSPTVTIYEAVVLIYTTTSVATFVRVPPRRIFPRDDGLTGGAPRNYPPSKGVQSGIRTTGGYL